MNVHRLSDAGVRNLGLLFTPPGLPLIVKAIEGVPTTSILVRGGPGTGKTTASLAMAHAIARQNTGAVLFLTTEFSPAEVVAKAGLLGIGEEVVLPWDRRGETQVGAILVQHLSVTDTGEPREQGSLSADQKQRAMEAVWGMLRDPVQPNTAVRAVVIDAFGLPDAEENAGKVRGDLVPFIQALEKRGVSTVLVEEAVTGGPDWLAFVTDVVLELSFQSDPDTRELHRKLVCKKCRYAQSTPGPHDYGLDLLQQRPSVFPDPLLAMGSRQLLTIGPIPMDKRARMFVPLSEEGEGVFFAHGGLLLNTFDQTGSKLTNAFGSTPDLSRLVWQCGPITTFTVEDSHESIHDSAGPYAAYDAILQLLERKGANAVEVHGMGMLPSPRYQNGLPRVIDALRRHGCMVLAHGTGTELSRLVPFADVAPKQSRGARRFPATDYCPVSVHLPSMDLLAKILRVTAFDSSPNTSDGDASTKILEVATSTMNAMTAEEIKAALDKTDGVAPLLEGGQWNPWLTTAHFVLSVARRRLGIKSDPRADYARAFQRRKPRLVMSNRGEILEAFALHTELFAPLAWTLAVLGEESAAVYWCLQAFERSERQGPAVAPLWEAIQAVRAGAPKATTVLQRRVEHENVSPLFLGFALRALALQGRWRKISTLVSKYSKATEAPAFIERRLKAEPLIESNQVSLLDKAAGGLIKILDLPNVPAAHRAEVCHNLGVIHEKLARPIPAIEWYQRATRENPHLIFAAEAIVRLENPRDPSGRTPDDVSSQGESNGRSKP